MSRPHYLTTEVENTENTAEQRAAAARTVARHSTDAGDCRDLLAMLGLLSVPAPAAPAPAPPVQQLMSNTGRCGECGCPTYSGTEWGAFGKDKPEGARVYGGRGRCSKCHRATLRVNGPKTDRVDAGPVIDHINRLREAGMTLADISREAGLADERTASRVVRLRQSRVRKFIADAILGVPVPQAVAA